MIIIKPILPRKISQKNNQKSQIIEEKKSLPLKKNYILPVIKKKSSFQRQKCKFKFIHDKEEMILKGLEEKVINHQLSLYSKKILSQKLVLVNIQSPSYQTIQLTIQKLFQIYSSEFSSLIRFWIFEGSLYVKLLKPFMKIYHKLKKYNIIRVMDENIQKSMRKTFEQVRMNQENKLDSDNIYNIYEDLFLLYSKYNQSNHHKQGNQIQNSIINESSQKLVQKQQCGKEKAKLKFQIHQYQKNQDDLTYPNSIQKQMKQLIKYTSKIFTH